jgi:REP element-mobilizing transposase RayT
MQEEYFKYNRKSHVEIGTIYFWTATINKWQLLLKNDEFKEIIIQSLEYLSNIQRIDVFAFVIMPNHVHFIWRINENNSKESTIGSFMKFTAHEFLKKLRNENPDELNKYRVFANNKLHEFWQRDALAIPLFTTKVVLQKLDYIHNNPIVEKWNLANEPQDYKYSTALFYENDIKNYTFIKDLMEEF